MSFVQSPSFPLPVLTVKDPLQLFVTIAKMCLKRTRELLVKFVQMIHAFLPQHVNSVKQSGKFLDLNLWHQVHHQKVY